MTDSAQLVVDRAVANAHPTVVGAQIGDRDASQVSADCRAHQDLSVSCRVEADLADLIQKSRFGVFVFFLVDFGRSQSSDENGSSVPDDLENFSWGDFRNINLEVGISVIPGPSIEPADDSEGVESAHIGHTSVEEGAEHVYLGSSDVGLVLVVDSVFVEPVVDVGLEVDMVTEISGPSGSHEEAVFIGDGVVVV